MAAPGYSTSHGTCPISPLPSEIMLPQSAEEEPRPKKLMPARARIVPPTLSDAVTITGLIALGRMWRNRMPALLCPFSRAARTKFSCRRQST